MSWSPDSKKIVVAAKAGKSDVLHFIDIESKKSKNLNWILMVFSAAWSPNGSDVAFVGQSGTSSDIYIFNLDSRNKKKVTDDIFSDSYPAEQ